MVYFYIRREETEYITKLLEHTKLMIPFKANNSLEGNLRTEWQSIHKRGIYVASGIHVYQLTCSNAIRGMSNRLADTSPKYSKNIYPDLRTIVT
jgi:hypothetical protein